MSWFKLLNWSGIVHCVTKSLNCSQCLFLCLCLLVGHAMSPCPSDQLLEKLHVSMTALQCFEDAEILRSLIHSVTRWQVHILSCTKYLNAFFCQNDFDLIVWCTSQSRSYLLSFLHWLPLWVHSTTMYKGCNAYPHTHLLSCYLPDWGSYKC